ncbi:PDxFFG protein [Mycoplasmopsis phocirhinis]|uniref:PDxFFG protein n=1 Tax=Mycoplasmopsis phocirhinis TaxID=142650 RepID=A0A4P6MP40_9BACT|nr:PDxFFG protein [Mycoplasmopsis phocirhinis]QBF34843.1 PDxFFG protein [Mycoplasmopsis phocirhinis]
MKNNNKKPKKAFNWRTLVWPKYLISLGIVAVAAGATIGVLKHNSSNPTLQPGTEASGLSNEFLDLSKEPKLTFVNSEKNSEIATFDPNRGEDGIVNFRGKELSYNEFLKQYYEANRAYPFLNIRYGMFDFYNEYLEAVSAKDFYSFTKWFMKNVSWGPEIITLKEFSIVKGVELQGNNITLGSHSNQDKEYTTIKFFPDAFFGSIPFYSTISGAGNANDSLLYKINKKLLTSDEIQTFLDKASKYNAFSNISLKTINANSFRWITDMRALINKSVFAVKAQLPQQYKNDAFSPIETGRLNASSEYVSIVDANSFEEAKTKFANLLKEYSEKGIKDLDTNIDSYSFEQKTIMGITRDFIEEIKEKNKIADKFVQLNFTDGKTFTMFNPIEDAEYQKSAATADADAVWEKSQNVQSTTAGFDSSIKDFNNLNSDLDALYAKWLSANTQLEKADFETFKQLVLKLKRIDDIKAEIVKLSNDISKNQTKEDEAIATSTSGQFKNVESFYQNLISSNTEQLQQAQTELATQTQQVNALKAQIEAEQNNDKVVELKQQLLELNMTVESQRQKIDEINELLVRFNNTLEQYRKLPTQDKVSEVNQQIATLLTEQEQLNEQMLKDEITQILNKANIENVRVDALIGLEKLYNEVKSSQFNEAKTKFDSLFTKAQYIVEFKAEIAKFRPLYKYYEKFLGGDFFAKVEPETQNFVLYSHDLAFSPLQLIAIDQLKENIEKSQINWREYTDIDGFIRSQSDDELKDFYVYAPEIQSVGNDFTAGKEAIDNIADSIKNEFDSLALSFSDEPKLKATYEQLSSEYDSLNITDLVQKVKDELEKLNQLAKQFEYYVPNYVKIMTLKAIVQYTNEQNQAVLKNEILDIINSNDDLKTHLSSFEYVIDNIDNMRKDAEKQISDFNLRVADIIKSIYDTYSKIITNKTSLDSRIEQYKKDKLAFFTQKMNELYAKIENANLNDEAIKHNVEDLVKTFSALSEDEDLAPILADFKQPLKYVKDLANKFNLDDTNELIRSYFIIVTSNVYKTFTKEGDNVPQERKLVYLATLFNPVIAFQQHFFKLKLEKYDEFNELTQNLKNELDELEQNSPEYKQKLNEYTDAQAQANYYLAQARSSWYQEFENEDEEQNENAQAQDLANNKKLADLFNLETLKQAYEDAYEFYDLEDDGEHEYDFSEANQANYEANRQIIDAYNAAITHYVQTRNTYNDRREAFVKDITDKAEKLLNIGNTLESFKNDMNDKYANAIKATKNIKLTNNVKNVVLDKMLNSEGLELNNQNQLIVATSKIELIEKLTKLGIISANGDTTSTQELAKNANEKILNVQLDNVYKKGSKLYFTLKEVSDKRANDVETLKTIRYVKYNVDAKADFGLNALALEQLKEMFNSAGYKASVKPAVIKEEGTKIVKDKNGNDQTIPTYSVFVEAYDGFSDELLRKVPWAAEWLEGKHLVKKVNDKGEFEYSIEDGRYLGFQPDTRIGLWSLLAMNNPEYKGLSVDFLKFVAAHEYGHHITLNAAQDLGDKGQKPLYGSALVPGSTPNIQNYYSRKVLDLYLKARTHLGLNSSPLLNQPNIVSENNEGEYLLYNLAKKDGDQIVIDQSTLENASDIWGHEIDQESLKTALENPKRRFLQTYEGLVEATKERRKAYGLDNAEDKKWLELYDLWLMNTLDQNSGTLNPTKYSDEQFPVKYMTQNADGSWSFKKASLDMLKGIAKDGLGNDIQFEVYKGEIVPKIVEGVRNDATGDYTTINKVLVFNTDGTPIVNVPLGVDLSSSDLNINPYYQLRRRANRSYNAALEFVNKKIKDASDTIKALIVKEFSINGWDSATTNTSLVPKTQIAYPSYTELFPDVDKNYNNVLLKPYLDHIHSRKRETGWLTPGYFFAKYYATDGELLYDVNIANQAVRKVRFSTPLNQEIFYVNPFIEDDDTGAVKDKSTVSFADILIAMYLGEGRNYSTISAGGKQALWLSPDEIYLPNIKLSQSLTDGFLTGSFSLQTLKQLNQLPYMNPFGAYMKEMVGHNLRKHIYIMVNENGDVVNENPRAKEFPAFWEMQALKINDNILAKDAAVSLFNSFYSTDENDVQRFGHEITFTDYNKFFSFSSVDTTRAKLDPSKKVVNWDIDYVKSKFSIERFANALRSALSTSTTLSRSDRERLNKLFAADGSYNEQEIANEIMQRFTSSSLALLQKDIQLGTIKEKVNASTDDALRYGWIFDKNLGYGLYKSNDVNADPDAVDEENWEISVKKLFDTFSTFATENGVSLDEMSLFDELILDDKTQMYSTQLHFSFRQSNFTMRSILLSIVKGFTKKSRPTSDVEDYFKTKTERRFNEFFSDYTYSFAEVINRDNLQITYSPSNVEFKNLPSFLTNVNESNTGLEYVIDGTPTEKWNNLKLNFTGEGRTNIQNAITNYENAIDAEAKLRAEKLGLDFESNLFVNSEIFSDDSNRASSYFGQFKSINNGWFKDRWYREMLNFKLYDDQGQPIQDDTIRIKDLTGKTVTNRPQAYWEYYIQAQGIGDRNLSNIWRNTDKDAVALFGYLSNDVVDKADHLVFEDLQTKEIKTLKINKENSSNMFYYKTQHVNNESDPNSRHYLKDEKYDYTDSNGHHSGTGFTAWVSDYAIMSNYSNKLLTPGHEYKIYFANKAGEKLNVDLGSNESVSENGKTFSQAPIAVYKKDIDGKTVSVIKVGFQFNGTK